MGHTRRLGRRVHDARHGPLRRGAHRRGSERARLRPPARDPGDDVRAPVPVRSARSRDRPGVLPQRAGGHRVVGHDGRLPGFNAQLFVAPDDGVGVVAFTNGSRGATSWLPLEMEGLLRDLLGVRSEAPRTDIAARPEVWPEICGRYALPPRIGDFRGRMLMGGGVEILVQDGRLMARLRVPVPALWRGLPLLPVNASDPYLFRLDLAPFGMPSTLVAFTPEALHTDLACLTLVKRAAKAGPRRREQRALSGPRAHPEADRLTADDRLILSVDAAWPQDVGALAILDGQRLLDADGSLRIEAVRKRSVPAFTSSRASASASVTPRRRLGGPVCGWTRQLRPRPSRPRASPSPREWGSGASRRGGGAPAAATRPPAPLWEMWLLPGLEGGRVGLFMRMHHVIGDGRAAMTIVAAFLDRLADPPPAPAAPWRRGRRPSARALRARPSRAAPAGARSRHIGRSPSRGSGAAPGRRDPEMRELLAERPGADTSLNRVIGPFAPPRAHLAQARFDLRHVARLHGATVNDVLLTVIAAGLRAVLAARGERTDGVTMRVFVPVSLRGRLRGTVEGNRVSQMAVPLRLDIADPQRRLRWVAVETAARKCRARTTLEPLFRIGLVRRLMLAAIIRQRVNVTTASLHGPRRPLYLAGARVLELFRSSNSSAIGSSAWRALLRRALEIGVVADADAYLDLDVSAAPWAPSLARLLRPRLERLSPPQVAARVPAEPRVRPMRPSPVRVHGARRAARRVAASSAGASTCTDPSAPPGGEAGEQFTGLRIPSTVLAAGRAGIRPQVELGRFVTQARERAAHLAPMVGPMVDDLGQAHARQGSGAPTRRRAPRSRGRGPPHAGSPRPRRRRWPSPPARSSARPNCAASSSVRAGRSVKNERYQPSDCTRCWSVSRMVRRCPGQRWRAAPASMWRRRR